MFYLYAYLLAGLAVATWRALDHKTFTLFNWQLDAETFVAFGRDIAIWPLILLVAAIDR